MSDPLEEVFPETFIERMREALGEDGVKVDGDAREVLMAFCIQGARGKVSSLLSLERTVLDCAHALSAGQGYSHAVFSLGRAAEALASARRLLQFSAIRSLEHGFTCDHSHGAPDQPEPDELEFIN